VLCRFLFAGFVNPDTIIGLPKQSLIEVLKIDEKSKNAMPDPAEIKTFDLLVISSLKNYT